MDIIEWSDQADLLLDKADSPWYTNTEKLVFFNRAQREFAESRYKEFEKDERVRKELLPLVRKSTGTNTNIINYSAINEFMFTLSITGIFNKVCGNGTSYEKISPVQLDDDAEMQKDPFNRAANDNAQYIEGNDGTDDIATIKSDSTPLSYVLNYLKIPRDVFRDLDVPANNINSEMPIFTHDEIINIAVRMMMANTEQVQNYQLQQNEIQNEN